MTTNAATDAAAVSPGGSAPLLEVLIIGAGFAGICAGIRLLQRGETRFRIFEKSAAVGGTWYDNRYPGAACDVPSHLYSFSFEPNPRWTRRYSPQPEILAYLEHCTDKYGLRPYIEHGARVVSLDLDEAAGLWRVRFADGREQAARHVINAAGGLHEPRLPDIPGRDDFLGQAMHTARWDDGVELAGRRVAVIGSAASAIQVVPAIAPAAAQVKVLQRTPNYIAPRLDKAYSAAEQERLARWPWLQRLYRWLIFMRLELVIYPLMRRDSWWGRLASRRLRQHRRAVVKDARLLSALSPDYQLGCKRILISDDFYETLNRDNVELLTTPIRRIEADGVRLEDDTLVEADVLVYATGYDIEAHARSIDVRGLGGRTLADAWQDGMAAYRGASVAGFPNYFLVTGPNTGVATTSVVFMIEHQVDYLLQLMDLGGDRQLVGARQSVQADYNESLDAALSKSVWASGCDSWYRRPDGRIPTLYPWNARTFARQCRQLRPADYDQLPVTGLSDRHCFVNGVRIACRDSGPADAPVIMLIHGLGVPLSGWPQPFVDGLVAGGFRVLQFDNRDIGRSEHLDHLPSRSVAVEFLRSRAGLPVRAPYQLENMADDAAGVLDAFGIESAHVVGASMGGMIAQLLAIRAPQRVRSLTSIMSTTGRRGLPGPARVVRDHLLARPTLATDTERLEYGRRTWQLIGSPAYRKSAADIDAFLHGLYARGVPADGVTRQMLAIMAAGERNEALARCTVPALVIHGDSDPLVPKACGEDTAAALPNARLRLYPGMGHDFPDALLPEFVREIVAVARHADGSGDESRAA